MLGYNSHKKRVTRGLALLDQRMPGWEKRVSLDSLDLSRGDRCILGQVYSSDGSYTSGYCIGRDSLFSYPNRDHAAIRHGFFVKSDADAEDEYGKLEGHWRAALAERITNAQADTDLAMAGD